ncbi:MAG: hypothetical protein ACLPTJ_20155 [Solirubrobacteraceae bacterium]
MPTLTRPDSYAGTKVLGEFRQQTDTLGGDQLGVTPPGSPRNSASAVEP